MDQRLFLAIALSMLVLIGYYLIFPPPTPKGPSQEPPDAGSETSRDDLAPAPSESGASLATAVQREAPASVTDAAKKGRLIEIQAPLYSATINTRGGNLTRFELTAIQTYLDGGGRALFLLERAPTSTPKNSSRASTADAFWMSR